MKLQYQPAKLLTLLLIFSETFFFGSLITGYLYLAFANPNWREDSQYLDIMKTGIFSLFLFASSGTLVLSEYFAGKGKPFGEIVLLITTIVFGSVFLIGQGLEYTALFRMDIDPSDTVFTSVFFTITGFHAFHVIVGLICLLIILLLLFNSESRAKLGGGIRYIGLYWHFVDIVWIVVFSVIYILPRVI